MNGSYTVPIGRSRVPNNGAESPRAASRMNKLLSAIPSSMCWPRGDIVQLCGDAIRSSLKVSLLSCGSKIARLLTQPPRLVETVTSGDAVTMRSASAGWLRAISASRRPKPACVDSVSPAGMSRTGRHRHRRRPMPPFGERVEGNGRQKRLHLLGTRGQPGVAIPFLAVLDVHGLLQQVGLLGASTTRRDCPCGRRKAD